MPDNKVLIIDDESDMTMLLKIELETEGYDVSVANDGREGLEKVVAEKPDLVLLDVMMPEMDGYEVLEKIKGNPDIKDVYVIMLTAKGLEEEIQKGLDLGADDYVSKPFHSTLLVKKIKSFF